MEEQKEYFQNRNNHSGYKPHELYIQLKYTSIKDEILNNKLFTLNIAEYMISLNKATKYLDAKIVKSISAEENIHLHYGIWDGMPLLLNNILSIILYCDWTDLCTTFSATFRKQNFYEPIEVTKGRNREFANWSKILRETVELYGQRGWEKRGIDEEKWNEDNNRIRGPFYCGMSTLMVMPEFSMRLCSPTSTSPQIEVAHKFAGDQGIIIELNNNGHWHSDNLRIWDCSWLSNYSAEDEKLLIGGLHTIRIQGIRTITNKKKPLNFAGFFPPLFYYDCMLTGISMRKHEPDITEEDKGILNHLIGYQLNNVICNDVDHQYIHDTFKAYTYHRRQVVINLHHVHTYFGNLKYLIMESSKKAWDCSLCYAKGNNINSLRCWACQTVPSNDVRGVNNLLKQVIFQLFPNVEHIVIYTTSGTGQKEYVFDLEKFLANIGNNIEIGTKFEIKATHLYEGDDRKDFSWLSKEWNRNGNTLKSLAKLMSWNVDLSHTEIHGARVLLEDTLTVTADR